MRNILGLKIETKVSLVILFIVVAIFIITVFNSLNTFKEFTNKMDKEMTDYEKVRIKKSP